MGTKWLSSKPTVGALQVMKDVKLNIDQQYTLYVNKVHYILGYI